MFFFFWIIVIKEDLEETRRRPEAFLATNRATSLSPSPLSPVMKFLKPLKGLFAKPVQQSIHYELLGDAYDDEKYHEFVREWDEIERWDGGQEK